MDQADENAFIDDGEISLQFGKEIHKQKALRVRQSAQWSRKVVEMTQQGARLARAIHQADSDEAVMEATKAAADAAGLDRVIDMVVEHGVPVEIVEQGTAEQVMHAFGRLCRLENPKLRLTVQGSETAQTPS